MKCLLSGPCPVGGGYLFSSTTHKCFIKILEPQRFSEAYRGCQDNGGSLAQIDGVYEQSVITNYFLDTSSVYVGLNDIFIEKIFEWVGSGDLLGNFTNWGPNQPADIFQREDEDCVHIILRGDWNDIDCRIVEPSVCEVKGIPRGRYFLEIFLTVTSKIRTYQKRTPFSEF